MKESDRRFGDRRIRPTPPLSKFTFWGRRRAFRRKADRQGGGYIDRYRPGLFFFLVLIAGLNVLDAFFTMMILDSGGWEANPVVDSVMAIWGEGFWVWKFGVVSASLIILCLHSEFRFVKASIMGAAIIYIGTLVYQVAIIICQ